MGPPRAPRPGGAAAASAWRSVGNYAIGDGDDSSGRNSAGPNARRKDGGPGGRGAAAVSAADLPVRSIETDPGQ